MPPASLDPHTTVIDLRPAAERAACPLPGPVLVLSLDEIEGGVPELPSGPPYLVVCRRGPQADLAARYLRADGYSAAAWRGTPEELAQLLGTLGTA